jgi:hypothetical protein
MLCSFQILQDEALHVGAASGSVLFLCDMRGAELNRTLLEIDHNETPEMNVIEYSCCSL